MKTLRLLPALALGLALTGCPTAPQPDPIPPTPKITSFSATPATVTPGGEVTLAWTVTDATKVTIADVDKGAVSGVNDQLTGTVKVVPTASTLYVLTALNDRGAKATAFVSVTVAGADADKLLFAAYPTVIPVGETGSLIWSAPGAKSVSITPMGGAALDLMGQLEAGSITIDPAATETTFTLDADGQTRTVTVTRGVAIGELTVSSPIAQPDDMITVTWKTTHAAQVSLSSPGLGELFQSTTPAEVAMGSFSYVVPTLPLGAVVNFRLDATGPGGATQQTVSLIVGSDPAVTEVTAPEYAKTGSTFPLAWKAANADVVQVRMGTRVIYETTDFSQVGTGSVQLPSPTTDTVYTVAAVALPSRVEATRDVTVKPVGAVTVMTFTATPATVPTGGDAVTLTWNVPNARRLRIEQDDLLTVVSKKGVSAESGTATVYANSATTTFRLIADNTLETAQTATATVTVTAPAELGSADGGTVFAGSGVFDLGYPVGTEIHGLPHSNVDFTATSAGFVDISTTGTKLTFTSADNATVQFSPYGFETFLYGQRLVNSGPVSVCTNGWLALRATTSTTSTPPTTFPGTTTTYDQFLAPFWANLELGPNGAVYWELKGEAPNQTLIVQWEGVRLVGTPTSSLTFQVQVTQAGVITYEYEALDNLPTTYTSATGLQASGGRGLTATPAAGGSVRFFGPRTAPVSFPASQLPTAGFVKIGNGFVRLSLTRFVPANAFGLSEVMFYPASTVTAGEWFEVFNTSTSTIDLAGWEIDFGGGNVHTIASSVVVPAGGTIVLGQSADPMQNDGVTVAYAYGTGFTMDDTAGTVTLRAGAQAFSATWTGGGGGPGVSVMTDSTLLLSSTGNFDLPVGQCTTPASRTFGTQVPQQRGTPGVLASCFPRLSTIPVSFTDIATTGTSAGFTDFDQQVRTIDISSAPINLLGNTVTALTISSNGFIVPGTYTGTFADTNKTQPSTSAPTGTLAVFWDDLDGNTGAGIYYQRFAAGADANNPAPHWVVEWKNFTHWLANDVLDFQAKLFDDGRVEYHYATMTSGSSSNYANGNSATVWLENAAGTGALPFSRNQPNITPNMAIRYAP
ncbi:MAG: lamin tail domain-containing protein [Myxococcota bacterium]